MTVTTFSGEREREKGERGRDGGRPFRKYSIENNQGMKGQEWRRYYSGLFTVYPREYNIYSNKGERWYNIYRRGGGI